LQIYTVSFLLRTIYLAINDYSAGGIFKDIMEKAAGGAM